MISAEILCMAALTLNLGDGGKRADFACSNMPYLVEVSKKYELDPALLLSLIHHESRWIPTALSKSKACGLTQVIPKWTGASTGGKKYTCEELFEPQTSIKVGAQVLSSWIRNYGKGNLRVGLCGYNAGYRCKGDNPKKSGLSYADRVRRTARKINRVAKRLKLQEQE
jgi:soluble lytic murein transglycosylase-like protein